MLIQSTGLFGQQFGALDTLELPNLSRPVFEWVDVDNDGLLDVFISGQDLSVTDSSRSLSFIYHQQPDTTFLLVETDLETYGDQLLRLADLNMDGRQDLVVAATDGLRFEHAIYENQGDFTWNKVSVNAGSSAWQELRLGDLNSDGVPELITSGTDGLIVYQKGVVRYEEVDMNNDFSQLHTDPVVVDIDKDGFTDLFVSGVLDNGDSVALLLINRQDFQFSVRAVKSDSLAITDYVVSDFNDDGFPDLLVSRDVEDQTRSLEIMQNDGGFGFNSIQADNRMSLKAGKVFAADLTSDGVTDRDTEGYIIGSPTGVVARERVVEAAGSNLTSYERDTLENTSAEGRRYGDFDIDGDLDYFEVSTDETGSTLWLFENSEEDQNRGAGRLSDLLSFRFENDLYIVWNIGVDDYTQSDAITYDMALGTAPLRSDVMAAGFDPESLKRTVVGRGNQGSNSFLILKDAPAQPLFASIMPIDNAFHYQVSACLQGGAGDSSGCNEELVVQEKLLCGTNDITLQTATGEEARWFSVNEGYLGITDQLNFTTGVQDFVIAVYKRTGGCIDGEVFSIIPEVAPAELDDMVICEGAFVSRAVEGDWESVTWTSSLVGELSNTAEFNNYQPQGDDVITVDITSVNGCSYQRTFAIDIDYIVAAVRDSVVHVTEGESVQLFASGGTSYLWSPPVGLSSAEVASPIASPDITTTYTVTAINDTGCRDEATVLVDVTLTAFAPDVFTPNGDGRNERYKLYDFQGVDNFTFSIFDRAGNRVYETSNLAEATGNGWDGTMGGTELPTGTYYWRIKGDYITGQSITVNGKNNGALQLIR
jgi:gliding motility-associated-like protein